MKTSFPVLPDIQSLLAQGMGPHLHWFPQDVSASRLAAVMVGMANTSGGTILLGITPRSGHIQGITQPVETLDVIFQAALLVDPPLVLPVPRLNTVEQYQVYVITIPPGLPYVYSLDGRYLGREGTQTNPLAARQLRQLLLDRGVVQFEAQVPPNAAYEDLDPEKVAGYVDALNLPGQEAPEQILLRRGCLRVDPRGSASAGGEAILRPTYAALLLFGRYPQQWLPGATVLAARFAGPSFGDCFVKQDISGTLPDQLRQAEAFARENLRSIVRMQGFTHQETTEVPLEAVRELMVNAVAHRDYNLQGDNIHLNLFGDRIEVHSPGGLPGPVTLENLLEARFSRNAIIVQVLSDLGFVERLGYGLDRVVAVMRNSDLRQPRFEEVAGSFRVTLYSDPAVQFSAGAPPILTTGRSVSADLPDQALLPLDFSAIGIAPGAVTDELNQRQEVALAYLVKHHRITNREYQDLCPDVHAETLRRDLADLVARNILIKVGDKRATYYIFK